MRFRRVPSQLLLVLTASCVAVACGSSAPVSIHDPHPVASSNPAASAASTATRLDPDATSVSVAAVRARFLLGPLPDATTAAAAAALYDTDVWPLLDQPLRDADAHLHDAAIVARQQRPSTTRAVLPASALTRLTGLLARPPAGETAVQANAGNLDGLLIALDVDGQRLALPRAPGTTALVTGRLLEAEVRLIDPMVAGMAPAQRARLEQSAIAVRRRATALVASVDATHADKLDESIGKLRDELAAAFDIDPTPPPVVSGTLHDLETARSELASIVVQLRAGSSAVAPEQLRRPRRFIDRSAPALAGMAPVQLGELRACLGAVDAAPISDPGAAATALAGCQTQLDALHRLAVIAVDES